MERRQSGERKQVEGPASGEAAARGARSCSTPRTLFSPLLFPVGHLCCQLQHTERGAKNLNMSMLLEDVTFELSVISQ